MDVHLEEIRALALADCTKAVCGDGDGGSKRAKNPGFLQDGHVW
jgi:hypothetical protein